MSGHWPPDWEDADDDFPEGGDQLNATVPSETREARLSEVAAYLASVSLPVLPDAVEARISAALAAEAATRTENTVSADVSSSARSSSPRSVESSRERRSRRRPPAPGRRSRGLRPALAAGSLVTCLLLAGLGYGLSRLGTSTSSGSTAAGSASSSAQSFAAAAPEPATSPFSAAGGTELGPSSLAPAPPGASPAFVVTESGTAYARATLAGQARASLTAAQNVPTAVPSPGSSSAAASSGVSAGGTYLPTSALLGCVLHVTGGTLPKLVDRAAYQGTPAYIIISSSRVWVVGLGCTAARPDLIATAPLAG
jgi:hypothetical protein